MSLSMTRTDYGITVSLSVEIAGGSQPSAANPLLQDQSWRAEDLLRHIATVMPLALDAALQFLSVAALCEAYRLHPMENYKPKDPQGSEVAQ